MSTAKPQRVEATKELVLKVLLPVHNFGAQTHPLPISKSLCTALVKRLKSADEWWRTSLDTCLSQQQRLHFQKLSLSTEMYVVSQNCTMTVNLLALQKYNGWTPSLHVLNLPNHEIHQNSYKVGQRVGKAMTEFTPDCVTKSEMELRQFEGFGSVRLLLVMWFWLMYYLIPWFLQMFSCTNLYWFHLIQNQLSKSQKLGKGSKGG